MVLSKLDGTWKIQTGQYGIWDEFSTLPNQSTNNISPSWSRDNSQIVFISTLANTEINTLYLMNANGEEVKMIPNVPENPLHPRWMPLFK
jgi:Tol biopolymer transport system component